MFRFWTQVKVWHTIIAIKIRLKIHEWWHVSEFRIISYIFVWHNSNSIPITFLSIVFDSLVQREIEGWNSNENSDSDKSSVHSSDGSSRRTSTLQSESDETFQVYGRGNLCNWFDPLKCPKLIWLIIWNSHRISESESFNDQVTFKIFESDSLFNSHET